MDLAKEIKRIRKAHGLSQTELAEVSGVSLPSITRLEAGKSTLRLDVLTKVAESLGYELTLQQKKR